MYLALDCANHAIRVNSVCPAWVDTPMVRGLEEKIPDVRASVAKSVPLGRIAHVDEIADVVIFLSSPRSSYVTGAAWMIDGGMTAAP